MADLNKYYAKLRKMDKVVDVFKEELFIDNILSKVPYWTDISIPRRQTINIAYNEDQQERILKRKEIAGLTKSVNGIFYNKTKTFDAYWYDLADTFVQYRDNCFEDCFRKQGGFMNSLDSKTMDYFIEYLKDFIDISNSIRGSINDAMIIARQNLEDKYGFSYKDVNYDNMLDDNWEKYYYWIRKKNMINERYKELIPGGMTEEVWNQLDGLVDYENSLKQMNITYEELIAGGFSKEDAKRIMKDKKAEQKKLDQEQAKKDEQAREFTEEDIKNNKDIKFEEDGSFTYLSKKEL